MGFASRCVLLPRSTGFTFVVRLMARGRWLDSPGRVFNIVELLIYIRIFRQLYLTAKFLDLVRIVNSFQSSKPMHAVGTR